MIDLSWNWIPSHCEWIRSKRSIEDKCCSKSIFECGRPVPRYRPRREDRARSFCDPENILLSVVAADSVGTAVGSRCCHRNDRKTKREPRTRLGVNLIFYSAARSWCAFYLHVRAGPSNVWVSSDRGTAPLRVWNRRHAMEKSDRPSSRSPPRSALHHPLLSRSPFSRIGRIHLESRTSRPGP